ncbi:PA3496 family putative envelope integrity protein [Phytohalomonas tamaricis]|uniref:PA3496 family putative envelope integrity protein n=1 Tax=Phytohalomonas tamaricis TaxID=2081032 RepID=UPI0021D483AE|nr:hypothetical protein [Phytohalomonas tamaricis]
MSTELYLDDSDDFEAMNDGNYGESKSRNIKDTLGARRRVEALLEERRLQQNIEDDWDFDDNEEE